MKAGLGAFAWVLLAPAVCVTGDWHVGESLTCQDCHLQHASVEGNLAPGGPFSSLLLKESINELCLSCHDGSDPRAPDVRYPVSMYSHEASAGFFSVVATDNPDGHNLGVTAYAPFNAEHRVMELSCASCHAVHGNHNFRNLARDPGAMGDRIDLIEGIDLFQRVSPGIPPTMRSTQQAYNSRNIGYRQGYSAWCTSCHNLLATGATQATIVNHHPCDVAVGSGGKESPTDLQHWMTGKGSGFFDLEHSPHEGIERVRFEMPTAVDHQSATEVGASNRVFCGTCHRAHGTRNNSSLVWNYLGKGESSNAGCQQCHNK